MNPDDVSVKDNRAILEAELKRALEAQRVMEKAHTALIADDVQALIELGFGQEHIAELKARSSVKGGGYPAYSLRSIRTNIAWLRRRLRKSQRTSLVSRHMRT
ncbi:hypothetical protein ACFQDN_21480 [Pseudomonas asuensis]|uniref:hypothetical protein n=1 Tax=Pseudomonas asuensis TaxID=1825787 RepID=UPI0016652625|nr:hypothetical protein [Pseudomonas asuensis]